MSPAAFYLPLEENRYLATESTVGPWFADAQHVGPPAALLARAVERCAPKQPPMTIARLTVEVLGPVPAGEVIVHAIVERPGRTIELVSAEMVAGGRAVLRARAWRMAAADTADIVAGAEDPIPPPSAGQHRERPAGWVPGYLDALEWRWLKGGFDQAGAGAAWARLLVAVVEGERPSPIQRLAAVADSANGIAARLDIRKWLFLNTDLTIHLHRDPAGEWIGLRANTTIGPRGLGTVSGTLFDELGHTGWCAQALTVRERQPHGGTT
jgi:Thioesterase-like superfamily